MIKGSIFQGYRIILNVHTRNNKASEYMKQKLKEMKGEIKKLTITIRN